MARYFYSLILYLLAPLIFLHLIVRGFKSREYWYRWRERLGFIPKINQKNIIWVHAVSVGEVMAAIPLIKNLQKSFRGRTILVTTTTPTGSEQVLNSFGSSVKHFYIPYDFNGSINRFMKCINPAILILMETELWPNTINYCTQKKIPVVLANARMSLKSYRTYRSFSFLTSPMFAMITLVCAQYEDDLKRFEALGVSRGQMIRTGNIKFDVIIEKKDRENAAVIREQLDKKTVLIASSTHDGEDKIVLEIFRNLRRKFSMLVLILVPRHPERFESVSNMLNRSGFSIKRRSVDKQFSDADVILGDTMGELKSLYGVSDIAFIGGSFIKTGGHNPIEAAIWEIPVLVGPHTFNFSSVNKILEESGGLKTCASQNSLEIEISKLLNDPAYKNKSGRAALKAVEDNIGALSLLTGKIEDLIA